MRLQFLGDSRDAFKWDLLHWICTTSSFSKLVFVPLLTPDDPKSGHGQSSPLMFNCRDFIRPFLNLLRTEPRNLNRIAGLAKLQPELPFEVSVFAPERHFPRASDRHLYWTDFDPSVSHNTVVFLDPDNGFETKTSRGDRWIRHDELKELLSRLPETSVVLVYQHRPRRTWPDVFTELVANLRYVGHATAVFDSTLAFVALAKNSVAGLPIQRVLAEYASHHGSLKMVSLVNADSSVDVEMARQSAEMGFRVLDDMEAEDETRRQPQ